MNAIADISYRKSPSGGLFVYDGDKLIGLVRKHEAWTVRGNRVSWEAYSRGKYIGSADTRKDAAALLS